MLMAMANGKGIMYSSLMLPELAEKCDRCYTILCQDCAHVPLCDKDVFSPTLGLPAHGY